MMGKPTGNEKHRPKGKVGILCHLLAMIGWVIVTWAVLLPIGFMYFMPQYN